jgi:hypothetical protein
MTTLHSLLNLPRWLVRVALVLLAGLCVAVALLHFAVSYTAVTGLLKLTDWLKDENKTRKS